MKLLLIDDDECFLEAMSLVLARKDIRVEKARNGLRALEILEDNSVDLIITDVIMPDTPIMSLVCLLKRSYPKTPLVLFSGTNTSPMIKNSLVLGADEFVTKPMDIGELMATINKYAA